MFTKRLVKDRNVQYPGRYQLVNVSNGQTLGTFDLTAAPGTVTEQGTIIGAAYLQPIEDGLQEASVAAAIYAYKNVGGSL